MKKMFLVLITLIIVGILIIPASAYTETLTVEDYVSSIVVAGVDITQDSYFPPSQGQIKPDMYFPAIENFPALEVALIEIPYSPTYSQFTYSTPSQVKENPSGSTNCTFLDGDDIIGTGTINFNVNFADGEPNSIIVWLEVNDWDIGSRYGPKVITTSYQTTEIYGLTLGSDIARGHNTLVNSPAAWCNDYSFYIGKFSNGYFTPAYGNQLGRSVYYWANIVDIDEIPSVTRIIDGITYPSHVKVFDKYFIYYNDMSNDDIVISSVTGPYTLQISDSLGLINKTYTRDGALSDNEPVTVYIKNSQTYALIANAHIDISASVNNTLHEVANETVPSGIYSIELQPTGGGKPNPDFYRLIVTAEGYNSIMPYIDFEVDGATTTIYAYLDPIGGAPEDENNTFIDFYVRDMSANPISGATVNFGGYTLITNSAGYTIFEVEKSKTYSWTVSKSGYGSLTGNAVIGSNARHTINTVLAPAVTPTTPTAIPTSTSISPTPTMTAPTGEPVSNWLEWFAAHFGKILGGGVEIGKIFMWLCFSVPVGVYVAKESRAGAAGFMAGAGVVTLFFVLIGWVPVWLLVLMALIIGLLYAKVFNNSDNGGGR